MAIHHITKSLGAEKAKRVLNEAAHQFDDLGLDTRKLRHELTRETHVVVGDHQPERRA